MTNFIIGDIVYNKSNNYYAIIIDIETRYRIKPGIDMLESSTIYDFASPFIRYKIKPFLNNEHYANYKFLNELDLPYYYIGEQVFHYNFTKAKNPRLIRVLYEK